MTPGSQIVTAQLTDCCDKSLDETNVKAELKIKLFVAILANKNDHLPVYEIWIEVVEKKSDSNLVFVYLSPQLSLMIEYARSLSSKKIQFLTVI